MMAGSGSSLYWFAAIVAMIPAALWLLKRTPIGAGSSRGPMRSVAALPLSANQRIVTVEVGEGEARRWLVLGVTAQTITMLHTMAPQAEPPAAPAAPPFAQWLDRLRQDKGTPRDR